MGNEESQAESLVASQAELDAKLDQLLALRDLVQVEAARQIAVAQAEMSQARAVANERISQIDGRLVALMAQLKAVPDE